MVESDEGMCIQLVATSAQQHSETALHTGCATCIAPAPPRHDAPEAQHPCSQEIRQELGVLLQLAGPTIVQTATQQAMVFTDQVFLGHLGTQQLAAAALGNMYAALLCFFLYGTATALDTLGAQAYGMQQRGMTPSTRLSTWSWVAGCVVTLLCIPISVGLSLGGPVARALQQPPVIAQLTSDFCMGLLPGIWPLMWGLVLMKHLQVQNVVRGPALVTAATFLLNIAANMVLIRWFGFKGAPWATSFSRLVQCAALAGMVYLFETTRGKPRGKLSAFLFQGADSSCKGSRTATYAGQSCYDHHYHPCSGHDNSDNQHASINNQHNSSGACMQQPQVNSTRPGKAAEGAVDTQDSDALHHARACATPMADDVGNDCYDSKHLHLVDGGLHSSQPLCCNSSHSCSTSSLHAPDSPSSCSSTAELGSIMIPAGTAASALTPPASHQHSSLVGTQYGQQALIGGCTAACHVASRSSSCISSGVWGSSSTICDDCQAGVGAVGSKQKKHQSACRMQTTDKLDGFAAASLVLLPHNQQAEYRKPPTKQACISTASRPAKRSCSSACNMLSVVLHEVRAALQPQLVWTYLKLGLPGGVMMSCEQASFDLTIGMAGRLGPAATAAHSALLNITALTFVSCPLAVGIAGGIRVGNLLGASQPGTARRSAWLCVAIGGVFMACTAFTILATRHQLGQIFTHDVQVVSIMASVAPFAALFQVSDGLMGTAQGVLRGCGKQRTLMLCNLVGFWLCGLPLGYWLCFHKKLGLTGLWLGIASGVTTTCVLSLVSLARIRWSRECEKAQQRDSEAQGGNAHVLQQVTADEDSDDGDFEACQLMPQQLSTR